MKLKKIIGTRVDKETFEMLDYVARIERRRRGELLRLIIEDFLAEYFAKKKDLKDKFEKFKEEKEKLNRN